MKTPAFVAVIASLLLAGISVSVQASSIPTFPSCLDPSGTISAQYDSGTHGIVGDAGVYTGSDKVYTIDGAKTLQCFCADNGNGIQTLWLNTSVFGQDVISDLVSAGWTYVPNGLAWGLADDPYYAKNSEYFCGVDGDGVKGGGGNGGGGDDGQVTGAVTKAPHRSVVHPIVVSLAAGAGIPMLPPTGSAHTELAISALIALAILLVWKLRRKTT